MERCGREANKTGARRSDELVRPSTRTAVHDADEPATRARAPALPAPSTRDPINADEFNDAGTTADGRGRRVACALFKAGRRADDRDARTTAESIEWRRAVSFYTSGDGSSSVFTGGDATKSKGAFWRALRRIVADAFDDDERTGERHDLDERYDPAAAADAERGGDPSIACQGDRLFESPAAAQARRESGWSPLSRRRAWPRRVSRRRMGMTPTGRTRGPNTRGTWSRMCSRDLLFPRRSDRRARRPRGSKKERGCFPKGERGLESGGRGRRRLAGNRSV